ncbi:serine/threonine-protein kinase ATG1c isoform X2 [Beta vulgaris subsp. vulgaris]|uniref:serine/threonine-protein kinase ATG1c isoform X2 n=1 Tax=Beta vulgaris subsp. vulgaris TaxID=3555 RepID=UPI00203692F0|nr:serine/threonine-protein kinase ATG1c isoform X2 [Beta vulgaris subsp. vulgaris]
MFMVPGKIHIVLEYCSGGDLFMHIQRHGRVPVATAKLFMRQLAAGLKVLRENNIIHRDLKPQNLLLSTNDNNSVLKIADFGFARSLQPRGLAETLCGSPLYMAPEIMQLQKYDAKADLWSVGAIVYQLVTGKTPFTGSNQMQLLQNIIRATELRFPPDMKDLSSEFVDLCQKLLRRNPVERLTFDEFFNHPFLCQKQLMETSGSEKSFRRADSYSLSGCNLLKHREENSPDDCLPFLLDDESSGTDGSPSFLRRRSSVKSTYGFSLDSKTEAVSSTMRDMDHISTQGHATQKVQTNGFKINSHGPENIHIEHSPICMEQRQLSSNSRALDPPEFSDQDYVLVSGPPMDVSASSASISKPSLSPTKSDIPPPAYCGVRSRSSAPVPIAGPSSRYSCCIGTLDSQSSVPHGYSQGSMDTADALELPSRDSITRLKSLQECAVSVKELLNEMVEAGRLLEAFSIQLVILAVWKQALHICHTQAVSSTDGSPPDIAKARGSINKIENSPDFGEPLDSVCSEVLEDVSTVIKREFFSEVEHAEELSKFVEPGSVELPDAMETIYQSALALGRHGAVDELMGDMENAASSYSKAVRLLIFLLVEAPSLILNPPFSLTNLDRFRLRNYINILNDRQSISRSQRMALLKPEGPKSPP